MVWCGNTVSVSCNYVYVTSCGALNLVFRVNCGNSLEKGRTQLNSNLWLEG
jgi:hypothetical protein